MALTLNIGHTGLTVNEAYTPNVGATCARTKPAAKSTTHHTGIYVPETIFPPN